MEKAFFIDKKFFIDPSKNLVRDEKTGIETHLEPRLLKLLSILCSKPGVMIERNYFIQEVWDNYAGGDEALTQAISFLRKVFSDENKKLIETIPKKGYLLSGTIKIAIHKELSKKIKFIKAPGYLLIIACVILLIIDYFIFRPKNVVSTKYPTAIKKTPTVSKKNPTIP